MMKIQDSDEIYVSEKFSCEKSGYEYHGNNEYENDFKVYENYINPKKYIYK